MLPGWRACFFCPFCTVNGLAYNPNRFGITIIRGQLKLANSLDQAATR